MVLRELGCNALDEGGGFNLQTGDDEAAHVDGATTIIVNWPALDEAYADRDSLFISAKSAVLYADNHIRILDGPCSHIFYRGVRVAKLDRRPSLPTTCWPSRPDRGPDAWLTCSMPSVIWSTPT